jgi:hypothetical protein
VIHADRHVIRLRAAAEHRVGRKGPRARMPAAWSAATAGAICAGPRGPCARLRPRGG